MPLTMAEALETALLTAAGLVTCAANDRFLDLCEKHKVMVAYNPLMHPLSSSAIIPPQGERIIECFPVICEQTFAIAMHELGHCVSSKGTNNAFRTSLSTEQFLQMREEGDPALYAVLIEEEEAAWQWAKENSPFWTPAMDEVVEFGMGSYKRKALGGK